MIKQQKEKKEKPHKLIKPKKTPNQRDEQREKAKNKY